MAMRDDLKAIGLSDEQASSAENVLRQHIAGEYIPKHRFDELNEKNKTLAQELGRAESERDTFEKKAKKAEDALAPLQEKMTQVEADWKKKYSDLEESHKKAESDRIALEIYNKRIGAIKQHIGDTAHDIDMVTSLIDLESLEVKDGKVIGVDKAVDQIKKEKAFLFKEDNWESTAPHSMQKSEGGSVANFGEQLAKKAQATDALTKAAADKYFK